MEPHEGRRVNRVARVTRDHYIVDECIICGQTHRHGNVDDLEPGGAVEREAHCPETTMYFLIVDENTEWEAE